MSLLIQDRMLTQDIETREDLACRVSLKRNREIVRQCDSFNCMASGKSS